MLSGETKNKGVGSDGAAATATAVTLEQILMHNFHDNRVEGLRRSVSGEKGSQVCGKMARDVCVCWGVFVCFVSSLLLLWEV